MSSAHTHKKWTFYFFYFFKCQAHNGETFQKKSDISEVGMAFSTNVMIFVGLLDAWAILLSIAMLATVLYSL